MVATDDVVTPIGVYCDCGRIGDDPLGQLALHRLQQGGVDVSCVRRVPGSTTTPPSNTLGDGVLQVNIGSGAFWGANSVNLVGTPQLRDEFIHATAVSFDLTMLASQLDGGAAAGSLHLFPRSGRGRCAARAA